MSRDPHYCDECELVVRDELHDFTERRWLTTPHGLALTAGTLRIPPRANFLHHAVLVSVPDAYGHPVSWVDAELAEFIWRCHRLGVRTVESCQGGPGDDEDKAAVWLSSSRDVKALRDMLDGAGHRAREQGWEWRWPRPWRALGWRGGFSWESIGRIGERSVYFPYRDIENATNRLKFWEYLDGLFREKTTPRRLALLRVQARIGGALHGLRKLLGRKR